jgi:hypothetical protein
VIAARDGGKRNPRAWRQGFQVKVFNIHRHFATRITRNGISLLANVVFVERPGWRKEARLRVLFRHKFTSGPHHVIRGRL